MEWLLVPLRLLIGVGLIWGSVRWAIAAEERRGPSMLPDIIGHSDKWSGQFDGDCGTAITTEIAAAMAVGTAAAIEAAGQRPSPS